MMKTPKMPTGILRLPYIYFPLIIFSLRQRYICEVLNLTYRGGRNFPQINNARNACMEEHFQHKNILLNILTAETDF